MGPVFALPPPPPHVPAPTLLEHAGQPHAPPALCYLYSYLATYGESVLAADMTWESKSEIPVQYRANNARERKVLCVSCPALHADIARKVLCDCSLQIALQKRFLLKVNCVNANLQPLRLACACQMGGNHASALSPKYKASNSLFNCYLTLTGQAPCMPGHLHPDRAKQVGA